MQLDHQFTVPAPIDQAWKVLLDVPRIAPCMPGATLDEFDGETFTGAVKVKLGPINLLYRGQGHFVEMDEAAHRLVMEATGKESRGSGTAMATVTSTLVADGEATRVDVTTDLKITGRPAQFGRGMIHDVGGKLLSQFASCLATTLGAADDEADRDAPPNAEKPADRPAEGEPSAPRRGRPTPAPHSPAESTTGELAYAATTAAFAEHSSDAEVEPIDLLEITGAQTALRRYGPIAAAAAGVAVLAWVVAARRRRRSR